MSPLPQAVPQAVTEGLSPEPQAVPQATDFALSALPHAVPQAEAVEADFLPAQDAKFLRAITFTSFFNFELCSVILL